MFRILLLASVVVGCGSKPAPLPKETNVELVKRGAEPYRELRYKLPKGTASTIAVTVTSVAMGRPSPTITTTMSFAVDDVRPDGAMTLKSTVDHTTGTGTDGAPMPADLVSFFDGTQISGTMSPVGTLTDTKLLPGPQKLPTEELQDELKSLPKMFEQASIALPNVAVGVGATWKTRKEIDENGVKVTAVTTITVTAITADTMEYSRSTTLSGPDQSVNRGGVNVMLTQIAGTGTGTGKIDLVKFAIETTTEDEYHAMVRDKKAADAQPEPFGVSMKMSLTPVKK